MTDPPWSLALMDAGSPVAPDPMTTTSASKSQRTGAWAFASCVPSPAKALAPTPAAAPFLMKSLRLTSPFCFLPILFTRTAAAVYDRRRSRISTLSAAIDRRYSATIPLYLTRQVERIKDCSIAECSEPKAVQVPFAEKHRCRPVPDR